MPVCLFFFISCLRCKDSKSPKNTSFFFRRIHLFSSLTVLKTSLGGHLRKPSQSRADLEVQYQKISPKLLFSTANSHKEIGDGGRSREGVCSGGHGLPGQKAKHAVWWWWWDSSTPGSNLSAVKISMSWLKCFFPHGQVFVKQCPDCLLPASPKHTRQWEGQDTKPGSKIMF